MLEAVGALLGRLDAALEGFTHPAARGSDLVWNPALALEVISRHRDAIADEDRRALVDHFVRAYDATLAPILHRLRSGMIHNDGNDYNILFGPPAGEEARRIAGLLDFGDMLHAWIACEPAVAMAYAMFDQGDPLSAAARVAAGYHRAHPLTEPEIEALLDARGHPVVYQRVSLRAPALRRARQRLPHGLGGACVEDARGDAGDPPAPGALHAARGVRAAGVPADPGDRVLARGAWRRARARGRGRSVARGGARFVRGEPRDRDPGAGDGRRRPDAAALRAIREAGATAGIGRYDEARLLYASDAFAGAGSEHPERRTVHIAVDLFAEPGSPVLAPLEGRVHALRDNAQRLDYGPTVILAHRPEGAPAFYTLYGHLSAESLRRLAVGDRVARSQRIGGSATPPDNGGWPPHVHFQLVTDLLDRDGEFPGVARASQRDGLEVPVSGSEPRAASSAASRSRPPRPTPTRCARSGASASGPRSLSRTARRSRSSAAPPSTSTTRTARRIWTWSTTSPMSATAIPASSGRARGRWRCSTRTRATCTTASSSTRERLTAHAAGTALGLLLRQLRQRGQRARAAAGPRPHARRATSWWSEARTTATPRADRRQPLQVRRARAARARRRGSRCPDARRLPRPAPARRPGRGAKVRQPRKDAAARIAERRGARRRFSASPSCPAAARSSSRRATSRTRTGTRARPAASASPTRSRSGSAASARTAGASRRRAWCPTSSPWGSRSATGTR